MHHIISDGVSTDILIRDPIDIYEDRELSQLRIQYKDYAVWEKELYDLEKINKQKEYWLDKLSGELPLLNLPTDYERPTSTEF